MPFNLGGILKSVAPWLGLGGVELATEYWGRHAGNSHPKQRTIQGTVIMDEHGNVVKVIRKRKKKVHRYPKYVYEALKSQAELTKKLSEWLEMKMILEATRK